MAYSETFQNEIFAIYGTVHLSVAVLSCLSYIELWPIIQTYGECMGGNTLDIFPLFSFPDPTLKEGKGLVYIKRCLGCTRCSISCDWHDNASFWHGNASTTLTCVQYTAIGRCHMIVTCKPHGVNLIGATEFNQNWNVIKPQKVLDAYQTLSLLEGRVWERDYFPVSVVLVTCKIHISHVGHMIAISAVLNIEHSEHCSLTRTKTKVSCYCRYFG